MQQHSRASTWPEATAERASSKRSLSPRACLEQLQHAAKTRGVSPLSQLRRCLRRALALLRARQHVVRQWRVLLLGSSPTPPHPTAIPCALYDSENSCCMQCGSSSSGARPESSRRPSHRPFPSCCVDWLATTAAAAPDTAQGAHPSLQSLDTCLKMHLRHAE